MKGTSVLREQNEKRILSFLRKQKTTARQDIANQLNISKNTVSLIIEDLINRSIVTEKGQQNLSKKGRPKKILALNSEGYKSVGLSIDINHLEMVLTDFYGNILEEKSLTIDTSNTREVINKIKSIVREISHRNNLIGIGIGIPGMIDSNNYIVRKSLRLNWDDLSLQELVNIGYPIFIQNNVNMITLTEVISKKNEAWSSVFYIRINKGIGSSFYSENNMVMGVSGTAGEIGHISVNPNGLKCYCGQKGCLEKLISFESLYSQYEIIVGENESLKSVLVSANDFTNSEINKIMDKFGCYLSRALVTIIHLINPHSIVIDSLYNYNNSFKEAVLENINKNALKYPLKDTNLSFIDNNSKVSHGAAIFSILKFENQTINIH